MTTATSSPPAIGRPRSPRRILTRTTRTTLTTLTRTTPTTLTRTTLTQTTQTTPSSRALARCIEPVAAGEFLDAYWETKPLAIRREEEGRYDDLLSAADVERIVCSGGLRYPSFRLVKEGAQLAVRDYTEDVPWRPDPFSASADVPRVLAEFEGGATIVLQGLHLNWAPLAAFCRELEATLGHPVQANAYFTPRRSQGLAVHHDTHDVFVLQIAGQKRWLVYEPVLELPLKDQRYSKRLGAPGPVVEDMTLRAGDTLYLPRGWLHEALTSETDSLHVTVGVNVYTWLEALKAAVAASADQVEARRSVPDDGEGAEELLELLARRLGPEEVAARKRRRLVDSRRPILTGQLGQLRALDDLDSDTLVERRPTVICELSTADGHVVLAFEGKRLSFPQRARDEVEQVVTADEPFRAAELPGILDEPGRLVLVRRLVREGFLRISERRSGEGPSA